LVKKAIYCVSIGLSVRLKYKKTLNNMGSLLFFLSPLIPIVGGILALSNWIVRKIPNAKGIVDRISPYTTWIGVVMFIWGLKEIFFSIRGDMNIFWLLTGLSDLLLGLVLGFGLISKYTGSSSSGTEAVVESSKQKTLAVAQIPLGIFAIVMGVLYLVKFGIQ
jgi:hypothetical protein